ncbi:MAG: hypothetical protein LBQ60_10635 [Bacteroidales bacterium]|jgi:hypothetical protein|nr:hypothetical protein [Bacteroidales bacterium]
MFYNGNKGTLKYLLLFGLLLCLSCKNINRQEEKKVKDLEINTEETDKEEAGPFVIRKISDVQYVTPENDTLLFRKPFFQAFEGMVEGKNVQAYLRYSNPVSDLSYYLSGMMYVEGGDGFIYFGFSKIDDETWENDYNEGSEYIFAYEEPDILKVIKSSGEEYLLKTSAVRYEAYDRLSYSMEYCRSENDTAYIALWEYDYLAYPTQYPEKYKAFFNTLPFSRIDASYQLSGLKDWRHYIKQEIRKSEEDCFSMNDQTYYYPCYLDENIYVVIELGHSYMGGAHGMYGTTYHNFDVKTGKLLSVEDIVRVDDHGFIKYFIGRLKEKYLSEDGDPPFLYEPETVADQFFLLPTGITFTYFPYELMGYALGEPSLFLSYEELEPYLVKRNN